MKRLSSTPFIFKHSNKILNKNIPQIKSFEAFLSTFFFSFKNAETRFVFFTFCVLFSLSNAGCRKGGRCEQAMNIAQSEVIIVFKDKNSGKYLYEEINPIYNKDSLKVFDPIGKNLTLLNLLRSAPDNPQTGIYVISFGPVYNDQTDNGSFSAEICKEYILKYSYNETDTLKVCFKSKKTPCGSAFDTIKVFDIKENLLASETDRTSIQITVTKE